ncbi:MAG: LacI family transcriptional regulator [Robiginitomaculum sp.]|nr:MAG: LacI family transcriptional regulator [Robiginitomaculum sp.]
MDLRGEHVTRLEDLARIAEVSVATVSRALNDSPLVNLETKRRVWRIAQEHNYHFRPSMPTELSSALATIVVVIPRPQGRMGKISDPFFQELLGGIAEAARGSGCDVLLSHMDPTNLDQLTSLMTAHRADGVIFLGQSFLHERFNRLAENERRFVVWGGSLPGQKYCSVGSDNAHGGARATSHLIRLGRKRIAFFGDTRAPEVMQRYQGYQQAHADANLAIDPGLVLPAHFEIESAEASVDALLSRGVSFDGIFAASDLIGLGAIRALMRAGRSVPGDVSVVGYDDVHLAAYSRPSLTTISQNMKKAGRLMVSKLLKASPNDVLQSEFLPTDLIVRESCGS